MKPPSYSPRERAVLAAADRVVCRLLIAGKWKEAEFFPEATYGEKTVRAVYDRVIAALRHTPDSSSVVIYAGAVLDGERCTAALPRDPLLCPNELK